MAPRLAARTSATPQLADFYSATVAWFCSAVDTRRRGFLYLVAVMDRATRKALSWRLANTMEADFCIEALQEALAFYGAPEIFNTDQGSQFTSPRFVQTAGAGLHGW